MWKYLKSFFHLMREFIKSPRIVAKVLTTAVSTSRAYAFSHTYQEPVRETSPGRSSSQNPLWNYFQNYHKGPGIWKWQHYFDIYHRHFSRFVGQRVNVLEIGVFSGGSLPMWRSYFGEESHIYGVDIEPACKSYENDDVTVYVGDQADRSFWRRFKEEVEKIDILIDDGGHTPEQQQITLEEMLPHLQPGGVYLCEDIHRSFNQFAAFAAGLVNGLNDFHRERNGVQQTKVSPFQSSIYSIHFYPYVVVIEKQESAPERFSSPRHGTEWQPFL